MNCNDCKNLIREQVLTADAIDNQEVAAHLQSCSSCRAVWQYEEKLRQSFAMIAEDPPPLSLTHKILAIPDTITPEPAKPAPGFFADLLAFFSTPTFKLAITAGLTGFFAAILLMKSSYIGTEMSPATERKTISRISDDGHHKNKAMAPAVSPAEDKTVQLAKVDQETIVAQKMESRPAAPETVIEKEALSNDDLIPGAVSFALNEEAEQDPKKDLEQSAMAQESMPQLAMARESAKSIRAGESPMASTSKSSGLLFRKSAPEAVVQSEFADSFAAAPTVAEPEDPRAGEISDLLNRYELDLPDGFIKIEDLAIRGFIGTAQLKKLAPPAGSGWFLQTRSGQRSVKLKKR